MYDKRSEQEYLHDFYQRIGSHEFHPVTENIFMVFGNGKDEQVDAKMYDKEHHQEKPCNGHDVFFCQRGIVDEFTHDALNFGSVIQM